MSDEDRSYERVDSLSLGTVDAVDCGRDVIVVASGPEVTVLGVDDRTRFDHDEAVADVAAGNRIAVLSENELAGYSPSGTREWAIDVDDGHAVAALPGGDRIGLLGPETLRTIDVENGTETNTFQRTRQGSAADDRLIGTPRGFAFTTWSFLTVVATDGTTIFDRNLEAVVRSLGWCNETIVTALQNEQIRGIDPESGAVRWRTDCAVSHVPPTGDEGLLIRGDGGQRHLDPTGTTHPINSLPDGDPYATTDGSITAIVSDGTVSVHRPSADRVGATVRTEAVGPNEDIEVEVTNPLDRGRQVTVDANLGGGTVTGGPIDVEIPPRSTETVSLRVESVSTEGRSSMILSIDGSTVERASVSLKRQPTPELSVGASLTPRTVDYGVVELEVSVENTGSVPLESVRLLETEGRSADVQPGATWRGTITRSYEPKRRVSIGIEAATTDERREYAPTCTLPEPPTIDVRQREDAVQATIDFDSAVPLHDELVVDLPGAGRVRTPVEIEHGHLVLVVPRFDDGIARISLEGVSIAEDVRLSDLGPASTLTPSAGRDSSTDSDGTGGTSGGRGRATFESATAEDRTGGPTGTESPPGTSDRSDPTGTETAGSSVSGSSDGPPEAPTWDGRSGSSSTSTPDVSVTRHLDGEPVANGRALGEHLVVTADGNRTPPIAIVTDSERIDVGRIAPNETVTLSRTIAPLVANGEDEVPIPDPSIEVAGDSSPLGSLSPDRLELADYGLSIRGTVDPATGSVVAHLANHDDDQYRIRGVAVAGHSVAVDTTIGPGEETTVSGQPDRWPAGTLSPDQQTVPLSIETATGEDVRALAVVDSEGSPDGPVETEAGTGAERIRTDVSSETRLVGGSGTVVLVFENDGGQTVSNVTVSARGDAINDKFYTEAHRDRLEPGDWIEHFVDLTFDVSTPSFDATVRYEVEDTRREFDVRITGPAVDDASEWTDDHAASWTIERIERAGTQHPVSGSVPALLSTPFTVE